MYPQRGTQKRCRDGCDMRDDMLAVIKDDEHFAVSKACRQLIGVGIRVKRKTQRTGEARDY